MTDEAICQGCQKPMSQCTCGQGAGTPPAEGAAPAQGGMPPQQ